MLTLGFYSTKEVGDKQVRIAYVLNEESLKKAVNIIAKGLKVYSENLYVCK